MPLIRVEGSKTLSLGAGIGSANDICTGLGLMSDCRLWKLFFCALIAFSDFCAYASIFVSSILESYVTPAISSLNCPSFVCIYPAVNC